MAGSAAPGEVTLVEGSSFCVSSGNGDVAAGLQQGVFFRDTRFVSRWSLTVNGESLSPLTAQVREPYRAVFVGRAAPADGLADNPVIVDRERRVGSGLREDIVVRNFTRTPFECTIALEVGADFADLFEVKAGRVGRQWQQTSRLDDDTLVLDARWQGHQRGVVLQARGAVIIEDRISYRAVIAPGGRWSATVLVRPVVDNEELQSRSSLDRPVAESEPARRLQQWLSQGPSVRSDDEALELTLQRGQADLGSLRILDPEHPGRDVVAAGAPWFMALFGRDSLLTSYMALPISPSLALGTLQTLARHQGSEVDPVTEEEPGRILHEVRLGVNTALGLGGGSAYYGTVDATPLFVVVTAELSRWGAAGSEIEALLPHVDRALDWIQRYGDRDGDGFVEYGRSNDHGLVNQGWKDSWDGINFRDGRLAEPPIALCEVQGYVYSAYLARAQIAEQAGDADLATLWTGRAAGLKKQFNERFWLSELGYYAVALDRDKQPVDACASNMGHCLWSGIVEEDKAPFVAQRLLSPEMFTGWGVRTLASDMGSYNPASYHNGSVWPHDNAILAAGLMQYGFVEHAQRLASGVLEAAAAFGGRLPELFCGFDRADYPQPVAYPAACSPQAWAATTPMHLIRTLLRFSPTIPRGELRVAPALPAGLGRLRLGNVPLAGGRLTIEVDGGIATVEGLPDSVRLVQ